VRNGSFVSLNIPPATYDEQLGLTFTHSFSNIVYNVTAVKQADSYGYGPGYLLNGLTDKGYWYQAGLSFDWPYTNGGYSAGFSFLYEVFNNQGATIFPTSGAGLKNFSGPVNDGDNVLLSLYFSSGNVVMYAFDWTTGASATSTYTAVGASYFQGQSGSSSGAHGFFTGLMTEWWHPNAYYGGEAQVVYKDTAFALSSGWFWADEWVPPNGPIEFSNDEYILFSIPTQLQYFSTNGASEAASGYLFITGAQGEIVYIESDGSVAPSSAPVLSSDNTTYSLTGNLSYPTYNGIVVERGNIIIQGNGYTVQGNNFGDGFSLTGVSNVTIKNTTIEGFQAGIGLNSSSNTISGNNITNNDYGIYLYGYSYVPSNNLLYHNNFINNSQQVSNINRSINAWDDGYPSGGNYWSGYNGVDIHCGQNQNLTGSDGIGDTPYSIDANNTDHYPFMQPNGWETYPVSTESNATITAKVLDKTALYFNVSGPTGKIGYVKATMPVGLNTTAIKVFLDLKPVQQPFPIITTNGTHYFIYFEFTLSTHEIAIQFGPTHDVAVSNIRYSKNIVGRGYRLRINVTTVDLGSYKETFNITTYANTTAIETYAATLTGGNSTTITFTLNTQGFVYGNYTITAYAWPVLGETHTADNTVKAPAQIEVTIPGDVGGYHVVNILDVVMITSIYGTKQGNPKFNPNCDIDGDGKITILDVVICTSHYGQEWS
jgi:parallel beta-helix repeat protein